MGRLGELHNVPGPTANCKLDLLKTTNWTYGKLQTGPTEKFTMVTSAAPVFAGLHEDY